jgi:hypothetical protein
MAQCTICRETIRRSEWTSHYQSVHPAYEKWFSRWKRNFYALLPVLIIGLVSFDYLWQVYGGFYAIAAGVFILAFFAWSVYEVWFLLLRTVRRYSREWENHPLSE